MIGAKNSGTKFRFNTVTNGGALALNAPRSGKAFEIRSCWFEGNSNAGNFVKSTSDDALVIGNVFKGGHNLNLTAGNEYFSTNPTLVGIGAYFPARRTRVIGNQFDSGQIILGEDFSGPQSQVPWVLPTVNVNICPVGANNNAAMLAGANIRASGVPVHRVTTAPEGSGATGTTFNASNPVVRPDEAFEPAEKLTTSDVGMGAPDPLCSGGPQR